MNTKQEVITADEVREPAPVELTASDKFVDILARAMDNPEFDLDRVQRLIDLHQGMIDRETDTAYSQALSSAQAEMAPVAHNARNQQTGSNYSKMDAISRAIDPIIHKHGFSLEFESFEPEKDQHVGVILTVRHNSGSKRTFKEIFPFDLAGAQGKINKTAIHAKMSATTYARKALKCLAFDIVTGEEKDDDGNAAGNEPISADQVQQINRALEMTKTNIPRFLKYMKVQRVEDIQSAHYGIADRMLGQKLAKMNNEETENA